jgi:hypothetical protein
VAHRRKLRHKEELTPAEVEAVRRINATVGIILIVIAILHDYNVI